MPSGLDALAYSCYRWVVVGAGVAAAAVDAAVAVAVEVADRSHWLANDAAQMTAGTSSSDCYSSSVLLGQLPTIDTVHSSVIMSHWVEKNPCREYPSEDNQRIEYSRQINRMRDTTFLIKHYIR